MKTSSETSRYRFNMLPLADRISLVQDYGVFIHTIYMEYHRVDLYHLNGRHFVEVWIRCETGNVEEVFIPSYKELDLHCRAIRMEVEWNE